MQTLTLNRYHCPVLDREVQVEELYSLAGTSTCQIDTQLVSWRCLAEARCPRASGCPLFMEYAGTGTRSFLDR